MNSESSLTVDALVVGAGITGLTAAYELTKQGKKVLLIESETEVGGCIRSRSIDGHTCELGANTFVLTPSIANLLEELALTEAVVTPSVYPYTQYVWSSSLKSIQSIPRSPFALLCSPLFTIKEKAQLVTGLFKRSPIEPEDSVADGFGKRLGRAVISKALAPALRGIFGGDADRLLLKAVFPKLFLHLSQGVSLFSYIKQVQKGRKIFQLRGGNQALPLALAEKLGRSLSLRTRCESIQYCEATQRWTLSLLSDNADRAPTFVKSNSLYLALGGQRLETLLSSLDQTLEAPSLRYASITSVHFSIPKSVLLPSNGFGLLFPKESGAKTIGVLFNSSLFPDSAPEHRQLITVCLEGSNDADDEIYNLCASELDRYLNIKDPLPLTAHRWKEAIPQFEAGYEDYLRFLDTIEKRYPGLHIIGVSRGGIGVPDRIERTASSLQRRN